MIQLTGEFEFPAITVFANNSMIIDLRKDLVLLLYLYEFWPLGVTETILKSILFETKQKNVFNKWFTKYKKKFDT